MPDALGTPPFIDRPVRPLLRAGIWFQRIQRWVSYLPEQNPRTGEVSLLVVVEVQHFTTNADGTQGADASALIPSYQLTYSANNTEIIDLATGEIVLTRALEEDAEWEQKLADDPRHLARRGNAFGWQLHQPMPTPTSDQLIAAMDAADGPPWFRFGGRPEAEGGAVTP